MRAIGSSASTLARTIPVFGSLAAVPAVRERLVAEEETADLAYLEFLLSPDLFIVGGGVSKHADEFLPLLDLKTPIVPAVHRNNAGIIGAAALALDDER